MADNLAQITQKDLLDTCLHTSGSAAWTTPPSIWVGLCSAAPTDTATNELTVGGNYARKEIGFSAATTASPSASTGPVATCTWTSASTAWGAVVGYILCAASTGSTGASRYIAYGSVSPNVTVASNDIVEFAAAAISLSFS